MSRRIAVGLAAGAMAFAALRAVPPFALESQRCPRRAGGSARVAEVLEAQPEDQQAARIPVEGSFHDPDLGILAALESVLRNAFVQAIEPGLERLGSSERSAGG